MGTGRPSFWTCTALPIATPLPCVHLRRRFEEACAVKNVHWLPRPRHTWPAMTRRKQTETKPNSRNKPKGGQPKETSRKLRRCTPGDLLCSSLTKALQKLKPYPMFLFQVQPANQLGGFRAKSNSISVNQEAMRVSVETSGISIRGWASTLRYLLRGCRMIF